MWFIFFFVVQRWLGRPLRQLSDFVGQLNIDNLGSEAFVLEDRGRHELHLLADKLNEMQGSLRKSVTENALLYAELERYRDHLEELVEVRTRELARSNADLEQFAYVASHDLQEPLRMVTSYLQLLEQRYQDRLDRDANEFIAFAVDGAKRMRGLIQDLLTYSRLGSKAKPPQAVDCNAVLKVVLRSLGAAIGESGAHIECALLPAVVGDETQLTQLFQNLVANAIKFRGERAPWIRITDDADAGYWRFAVQDNGIGIAPEYFERIFVMFQRLHNRSQYPGTGIGLALCKKIVERHGGRIRVESSAEGSTFHFTLPQTKGDGE